MIHETPHRLAGQTVKLELADKGVDPPAGGFRIEDWWDRVASGSWMYADSDPAALKYALRAGFGDLPTDDDVVYGKDERGLGHIVHVSELVEPTGEVSA